MLIRQLPSVLARSLSLCPSLASIGSFKNIPPDTITRHHKRMRIDDLKHAFDNQEAINQFISQEKAHFQKYTSNCREQIDEYFHTTNRRKDKRTQTVPEIYGDYEYVTTASWYKDKEYTLIYRRNMKTNQEVLALDMMKHWPLSNYWRTIQLCKTVFSQSHRYLGFGVDLDNSENINFMIKDIDNDRIVGVPGWQNNILRKVDNVVFYKDQGIFYTKTNNNHRPFQLTYQNLKTGNSHIIYTEKDEAFYLDISKSKDEKKLIVNSNGRDTNSTWVIDIDEFGQKLQSQYPLKITDKYKIRTKGEPHKILVHHSTDKYIIWKNGLIDGDQIVCMQKIGSEELVLHKIKSSQTINDIDIFEEYVVLYMKNIVTPVLRVISLHDQRTSDVQLPYLIGEVTPGANQNFKTEKALIYMNNLFVYNEGYELSLKDRSLKLVEKFQMEGPKFNINKVDIQIHQVPTETGQFVPLTTIVPKRNQGLPNKMILHSYGYYGISYELSFNHTYWTALEMGWSLAYAHIRGGGEKGIKWHLAAKQGKRSRSWEDLEECVAYLIMHQYTHPSILTLASHSAGAITIWKAINRNPHLYKAALFSYPFMDVLSSLLDSTKALSQTDYHQFGNPVQNSTAYNEIESYSPYETIYDNKDYPFIIITGGGNDYRCPIQQIAKFVTRFRKIARSQIPSHFLNTETENPKVKFDLRLNHRQKQYYQEYIYQKITDAELQQQKTFEAKNYELKTRQYNLNGILVKINEEASHEGLADAHGQIYDGCEKLGILDYLIEEASYDVKIKTGKNVKETD